MEALFFLLLGAVDILFCVVCGVISVCLTLLSSVVEVIFRVVLAAPKLKSRGESVKDKLEAPKGPPKWAKPVLRWLCGIAVGVVGILAVINFFFFEPVVGRVLVSQLGKQGIEVKYDSFAGNLFSGAIKASNLVVKSEQWEIGIDRLDTRISLSSLISKTVLINKLHFDGLSGDIQMPVLEEGGGDSARKAGVSKKKRYFTILDLQGANIDIDLEYTNGQKPPIHSISFSELQAEKFRSKWALFYVFFRTNLEGELNGQSFTVSVENRIPIGKRTLWKIESLPLEPLWGEDAPWLQFEAGTVELDVSDEWLIDGRVEIDMDWRMKFSDIQAVEPKHSVVRKAIASYLNAQTEPVDIQFGLTMNPDKLEGSSSEASNEIFRSVMDGMAESVARRGKFTKEESKESQKKLFEGFKGVLDKARK